MSHSKQTQGTIIIEHLMGITNKKSFTIAQISKAIKTDTDLQTKLKTHLNQTWLNYYQDNYLHDLFKNYTKAKNPKIKRSHNGKHFRYSLTLNK